MQWYEEAIRSAHDHGFVQNEALAYELAAKFYRKRGLLLVADTYLRHARLCYLRWGADGKVRQLNALYPGLEAGSLSSSSRIGRVDAITVVKASQAISGEIVLCNLLDTLMRVVIENAGAQKGYLLLAHGDELTLDAQGGGETSEIKILRPPPAELATLLPISMVNYVRRTRECVILDDASDGNMFSQDQYIAVNKPVSVLCLPILRQGRLIGLLYLENNLV
jgi:GAF domain-containing protein